VRLSGLLRGSNEKHLIDLVDLTDQVLEHALYRLLPRIICGGLTNFDFNVLFVHNFLVLLRIPLGTLVLFLHFISIKLTSEGRIATHYDQVLHKVFLLRLMWRLN